MSKTTNIAEARAKKQMQEVRHETKALLDRQTNALNEFLKTGDGTNLKTVNAEMKRASARLKRVSKEINAATISRKGAQPFATKVKPMTVEQIDATFKSAEESIVILRDYAEHGRGTKEQNAARQRFYWLANHLFDRDILDDLNSCIDNGNGPKHTVAKHRQ
jgi:succinate dehydrogenase/fumarate reductase flavoprotein subunit